MSLQKIDKYTKIMWVGIGLLILETLITFILSKGFNISLPFWWSFSMLVVLVIVIIMVMIAIVGSYLFQKSVVSEK